MGPELYIYITHIIHNIRIYADPYVELSQNLESSCPNVYLAIVMLAPLKNKPLLNPGFGFFVRHDLGGQSMGIPRIPPKAFLHRQSPWIRFINTQTPSTMMKPDSNMVPTCTHPSTSVPAISSPLSQEIFRPSTSFNAWPVRPGRFCMLSWPPGRAIRRGWRWRRRRFFLLILLWWWPRLHHCPMQRWAPEDETGELDIFGFRPFSLPFLGARKRVANMFIQRYHISQIRWIQTKTIYQNTKTDQNCQNVIIFRKISNRVSVRLPNRPSSMLSAGVWSKCPASSAPPKLQSRRTARHLQTSSLKCWWTPLPCPGRRRARGLANRTAGPSQPGPWWRMVDEWLGFWFFFGVNFCG